MVIAFVGQKGGVGKSTFAIFAAAELTARGYKVLLVDADPQGTARTWGEVASETGQPAPTIIAMGANMHRPGQLDRVGASYDLVIVDCPPRHGDIQRSALMVADVAVIPCGPSPADAWALASSLELIEQARILRPTMRPCIAITRVRGATRIARSARAGLAEADVPILDAELGYRVVYQEALATGQGVAAYAPKDRAAKEFGRFVDQLLHFMRGDSRGQTGTRHQAA